MAAPAFESVWISDHFMTNDRYRLECWTLLTWIAARHPEPLLGTIVLANSYRHPALLAKMAASLQELSGGRLILGYGAGWAGDEYRGYGYPFPPLAQRIEEMAEAITSSGSSGRAGRCRSRDATTGSRTRCATRRRTRRHRSMIGGDGGDSRSRPSPSAPTGGTRCTARPTCCDAGWPSSTSTAPRSGATRHRSSGRSC